MDLAGFHGVDSCGVDTGMAKDIRQTYDILLDVIVGARKQMAKIVGKDLLRGYTGKCAQALHVCPDIGSIQRISVFTDENGAAFSFLIPQILPEQGTKLTGKKYASIFSLATDHGAAVTNCFCRNKL